MSGPALEDYVEVNERIAAFYAKHPEGSLQTDWEVKQIGDQTFIIVTAYAYRAPYDVRPGIGTAWEPFPGKTPFTNGSELMVGETSAWGRAIAALGFKVKRSVASADEVRAAQMRSASAPKIDGERADGIVVALRDRKMSYKQIDILLGAAGIDAVRAHSPKALRERLDGLTVDEADALDAAMQRG